MTVFWLALLGFVSTPVKVEMVESPKKPGPYTLVFEEDLRFGAEEDEDEYLWVDGDGPTEFAISPNGHFFIVDLKNSQILEFDVDGKFKRIFAKRGEGPGEYQKLTKFAIFDDGSAVGFDSLQATSKFSYYDKDLNFEKVEVKTGFGEIIARPFYSRDGKLFFAWYASFDTETNKLKFKTGMFRGDRTLIKEFSANDFPVPDGTRLTDPEMWVDYLAKQFETILNRSAASACFLADNSILVSNAKTYEIEHWDPTFTKHEKTYKKAFEAVPLTESDKESLIEFIEDTVYAQGGQQFASIVTRNVIEKAIQKADLPPRKDPLASVVPMEKNQFMVVHSYNFSSGSFKADVFDENGKCIGKTESPANGIQSFFGTRMEFRNGFAYALIKNEEGDNQMVRYRYKLTK